MSVSKSIIKKKGHPACLREMTGQTYPTSASSTSTKAFSRVSFHDTFFDSWKNSFKSKDLKKIDRYKVSSVGKILVNNL